VFSITNDVVRLPPVLPSAWFAPAPMITRPRVSGMAGMVPSSGTNAVGQTARFAATTAFTGSEGPVASMRSHIVSATYGIRMKKGRPHVPSVAPPQNFALP
jgi:hypothetical protein